MQDLPAMLATALLTNIHDHYTAVWLDRKLLGDVLLKEVLAENSGFLCAEK